MSNQEFENISGIKSVSKLENEFQNIEFVIQGIFQILDEYDKINTNLQKVGGEKLL